MPSLGNWAKQVVSGDKYQQNGKALYVFKSTSALIQVGKKLYIEQNNEANAFDLTSLDPETWSDQASLQHNYRLFARLCNRFSQHFKLSFK